MGSGVKGAAARTWIWKGRSTEGPLNLHGYFLVGAYSICS